MLVQTDTHIKKMKFIPPVVIDRNASRSICLNAKTKTIKFWEKIRENIFMTLKYTKIS